jgi:hypothetical protein
MYKGERNIKANADVSAGGRRTQRQALSFIKLLLSTLRDLSNSESCSEIRQRFNEEMAWNNGTG